MNLARIVVLFIALLAGGVAAYFFSQPTEAPAPQAEAPRISTVNVLVARADIPMGASVTDKELQWIAWPTAAPTSNFITEAARPKAIEELTGSIARTPFVVGEPIREAKLIKANGSGFMAAILPSGKRAASFEISPETGAGEFILPNDYVDVLLTRREVGSTAAARRNPLARSSVLLTDIRVLAVDQTIQEKDGEKVVIGKTATLELTPEAASKLAAARQNGTLSLTLRSLVDSNKNTLEEPRAEQTSDVNVIRFGLGSNGSGR